MYIPSTVEGHGPAAAIHYLLDTVASLDPLWVLAAGFVAALAKRYALRSLPFLLRMLGFIIITLGMTLVRYTRRVENTGSWLWKEGLKAVLKAVRALIARLREVERRLAAETGG